MTPLRIQKTSAFKDQQQHNSLHNATAETAPTSLCILSLFPGKERCIRKTWNWNHEPGRKKCILMPTKQFLQNAVHHWGQQPAYQTQAQPSPAEGTLAVWPLTSLCTHMLYKTPEADTSASQLYCFNELLFKQRQPLQQGQSSSAPKSCTVTCQAVAVCSEQMDFPAVSNTSGNRILV